MVQWVMFHLPTEEQNVLRLGQKAEPTVLCLNLTEVMLFKTRHLLVFGAVLPEVKGKADCLEVSVTGF